MKVFYKTIVETEARYDVLPYRALRTTMCCAAMESAWGKAITFAEADYGTAMPVVQFDHATSGWEETNHDYLPISFCPFCGEKIECVEEQRVRLVRETEQYQVTETRTRTHTKEVPE